MRFDASMESLINIGRSESFADLNETDLALSRSFLNQGRDVFNLQGKIWRKNNQDQTKNCNNPTPFSPQW